MNKTIRKKIRPDTQCINVISQIMTLQKCNASLSASKMIAIDFLFRANYETSDVL